MRIFPFSRFIVYGNSMLPTLKPGQEVLTFNWITPQKGDVIVVKFKNKEIVKRIVKIKKNNIYALGDNKKVSRLYKVSRSEIVGKVIFVR